jgi:hypothetical protein
MPEVRYKPFFRVVDCYQVKGHLILISDRTNSGHARTFETIQVHVPGEAKPKSYQAGCVSYARSNPEGEIPFCMAVKGIEPEQIPIGSTVWLEDRGAKPVDLSRYKKSSKPPIPMIEPQPQAQAILPQVQKGKMETV